MNLLRTETICENGIYLSIYLSVYLSIYLSLYIYIYIYIYMYMYILYICLSIYILYTKTNVFSSCFLSDLILYLTLAKKHLMKSKRFELIPNIINEEYLRKDFGKFSWKMMCKRPYCKRPHWWTINRFYLSPCFLTKIESDTSL